MVFAVARGGPGPASLAYRRTIAGLIPPQPLLRLSSPILDTSCQPLFKRYGAGRAVAIGTVRTFVTTAERKGRSHFSESVFWIEKYRSRFLGGREYRKWMLDQV